MAARGGRTVRGEEERAGSFFRGEDEDADLGLPVEFQERSEAGLAESRWEAEVCRMLEGREKDCSNGFGSRSKSERVCRVGGCRSGAEAESPFLGGVDTIIDDDATT